MKNDFVKKGLSLLMLFLFWPLFVHAEVNVTTGSGASVQLQPGFIAGSMLISGATMSSASVNANSVTGGHNASVAVKSDGSYLLTVNTPVGGSLDYNVSANGYSDSNRDYVGFNSQRVTVTDGQTATLNFVANAAAQGTITVTGGATFSSGSVYATYSDAAGNYTYARTNVTSNGQYHFPMQANSNIRLYGTVYTTDGQSRSLSDAYHNIAANQTATQNWSLNIAPVTRGSVNGTIHLVGATGINFHRVSVGVGSSTVIKNPGNYLTNAISVGTYIPRANSYFNGSDDYYRFPDASHSNRSLTVVAGNMVTNDIVADAAYVNGALLLSGSKSTQDLSLASIVMVGADPSTLGGFTEHRLNIQSGRFKLLASTGTWSLCPSTQLNFYNSSPASYLKSRTRLADNSPQKVTLISGQTVNVDCSYALGSATVNYSVAGGLLLSNPSLSASLINQPVGDSYRVYTNAYGQPDETTQGRVTFIGPSGTYRVTPRAIVNGSNTSFGQLQVEVVAGVDTVVDVGGPSLTISSPEPDSATTATSISVTGTASNDTGVASVVINGVTAALTSTNNAADLNEVSFTATISVNSGLNTITTVSTDSSGKKAEDSRKVYVDQGPPTLSWTPADGTVTQDAAVTLQGTVTDDNGVSKLTVNGYSVAFTSTNNAADANEVSFTTSVTLADGANDIVVVATDVANQATTQTHRVSKSSNQAPVANAGADLSIEQTSASGASVTLDGSASSDADGDVLIYNWTGPFGSASGVAPTVQFASGISNATLVVNDGTVDSQASSIMVIVSDNIAPVVTAPAAITVEATGAETAVQIGTAMATDAVGVDSVTSDELNTFPLGTTLVTWTATDASGNSAIMTQTVTVSDTIAPVLTVPADVSVEATGAQTSVIIGNATATDIFGFTISNDESTTYGLGTTLVTWTAKDVNGNVGTAIQTVTVADTTAPVVTANLTPISEGDDHGDSDEGRFTVNFSVLDSVDANSTVIAELIVAGHATPLTVTNGQLIEFEYEDEKTEVEVEDGVLEIEAPSMLLRVTATDASGNVTVVEIQPQGLSRDNDDDYDRRDDHDD